MTGTYFETFLVGGLGLLVAAVLAIAWLLWRQDDTRREAIKLSLEGIGHEFRFNMFQTVREISDLEAGEIKRAGDLPELAHPQLDAVLAETMTVDKRALAAVQATYQSIEASKRKVRLALSEDRAVDEALTGAKAAAVDGISTLYLWEAHEGRAPQHARSTRSWWVRDWMKAHGFEQDLMPGLALRDAVVENLRVNGMVLTPKPLMLTAYEYYSRPYDRKSDPRGVFWARGKAKADAVGDGDEAEDHTPAEEAETPPPPAEPERAAVAAPAPAAAAAVTANGAVDHSAPAAPVAVDAREEDESEPGDVDDEDELVSADPYAQRGSGS